jgi:hypothetical protein
MLNVYDRAQRIRDKVKPHYKLRKDQKQIPVTVYQDYCTKDKNRIMLVLMNPSNKSKEDWIDENRTKGQQGFKN